MEAKEIAWTKGLDSTLSFLGETKDEFSTEDIHVLRQAFFQRHLDKGIKAKNLAKHCGISASMLTMLLKGERKLGAEAQRKIETQLGLERGAFSNALFLKETLLCDFSNFEQAQAIPRPISLGAKNLPSELLSSKSPVQTLPKKTLAAESDSLVAEKSPGSGFDLSSLDQMVRLSQCQVSVETIGVKGNELTLMVKLKF